MTSSSGNTYFLPILSGVFVAILLISTVTSTKIIDIGPLVLDGGTLLFPLSYIIGDILTEVYGYKSSRKVIWTGLFSLILFSLLVSFIGMMPANGDWQNQGAYDTILGMTPRIILASVVAFFIGEFTNSYILAKMKIMTHGKKIYTRLLFSSIFGHGLDTIIFILIAFLGVIPGDIIIMLIFSNFLWKMATEMAISPLTVSCITFLKKKERSDVYDEDTDFSPFSLTKEQ